MMPYLNIVINKEVEDEAALLKVAGQTVAKAANKPSHKFQVY